MMMWGNGHWYNNGSWGDGSFWWMGLVMMTAQILFWGLAIWFGVSLFKRKGSPSNPDHDRNEALDILKERYARGEIDTEEFRQRKENLVKKF